MLNNKILLLYFLLFLTCFKSFGQEDEVTSQTGRTKKYSFILYLSGGAGYFPSNTGAPAYLKPKLARINPVTTARIMWKPDHRLKAGFESGYMTFYSYQLTDANGNMGKVSLDAIPLLLEFSVSVKKHFNLFAGPGFYILKSNLNYAGTAESNKVSTGWMAAAAYTAPLSKAISLGAEAKWLYAAETIRGSFGLQLQASWKFLKW
ncbi:hypothetical protein [Segetibacter aerophilus]|uniref:Outer membrane protein beta-barrel domain-containing protein n=1 Tax=Segetibacter aerophilus TaxID=670293 RepID=A0A512B8R5_9BACT|nr:hypothetical protein [Segetibacter aerophilus]GEO08361.1 hypothetical protein SAE01_08570 [Segetibacter aerophilus]